MNPLPKSLNYSVIMLNAVTPDHKWMFFVIDHDVRMLFVTFFHERFSALTAVDAYTELSERDERVGEGVECVVAPTRKFGRALMLNTVSKSTVTYQVTKQGGAYYEVQD